MIEYFNHNSIVVRDSVHDDIESLANSLRESDIEESWVSYHLTPYEALKTSFQNSSLCLSILKDEKVIAMYGIVPHTLLGDTASIWLLGSSEIDSIKKTFLKLCRSSMKLFYQYYSIFDNYVYHKNTTSIEWLKWLGAEIYPIQPYGIEGLGFHYFVLKE